MSAADLINLSSAKTQYFPFQKPVINYIFKNSNLILSQKLIKCCKFFKLLHLKINKARLESLDISSIRYEIDGGLSKVSLPIRSVIVPYKLNTVMKSFTVSSFYLSRLFCSPDYYLNLMPKLDFSLTTKISITTTVYLGSDILEKLIHPSLLEFKLICYPSKNLNPVLLIFQRCPKIKEINIWFYNNGLTLRVLTKNMLKEILLTKRETKIEKLSFEPVSNVEYDDFMKLIDEHLAPKCNIALTAREIETSNSFKEIFEKIKEIRKKESKDVIIKTLNYYNRFRYGCYLEI